MNELILKFTERSSSVLPFQPMPGGESVAVYRFGSISHEQTFVPHRHNFDMVLWATKGSGIQIIDYKEYEMIPGRLFFIRQGQIHQIRQYAEDGWMVLFDERSVRDFKSDILDNFYHKPYLDLRKQGCETFLGLFSILQQEIWDCRPNLAMVAHLLNGMLLCVDQASGVQVDHEQKDRFVLVKMLKALIDQHYREHKDPEFYYNQLGMSGRVANKLLRAAVGKTVYELLQDRLLLESKSLLTGSSLSVKQIAGVLDFSSTAYFCLFFKKMTGSTPLDFRVSNAK